MPSRRRQDAAPASRTVPVIFIFLKNHDVILLLKKFHH
jgi:hypothetical protein